METFSTIFWITLGIIFISAIFGAIIKRRQRDRCLRLLDDFHVTLEMTTGRVIWGDLKVFPQGLELVYDAPYATQQGIVKAGALPGEQHLALSPVHEDQSVAFP